MKLDELVNKYYNNLNLNDLHIWRYITNHREKCINMTIEEIAEKCSVSRTGILRFAKKISLQGFSELKFYLKMEVEETHNLTEEKVGDIIQGYMISIQDLKNISYDKLNKMIFEAKRIFVYGSGSAQHNAIKELKRLLFKLNTIIYIVNGKSEYEHLIDNVEQGDVLIAVSLSGENKNCIEIFERLKDTPCQLISITRKNSNTLAKLADYPFYFETPTQTPVLVENNRVEPLSILYFVMEMIFLKYAVYHYNRISESESG